MFVSMQLSYCWQLCSSRPILTSQSLEYIATFQLMWCSLLHVLVQYLYPCSFTSRDNSTTMGSNKITEPTSLTIRILQEITDNFSEERAIGQGAYGKVYKVRFLQDLLLFWTVSMCAKLRNIHYLITGSGVLTLGCTCSLYFKKYLWYI
jgi:hypothetical protein